MELTLKFLANFNWSKTRSFLDRVETDYLEASDGRLNFKISLELTDFQNIKWDGSYGAPVYIDGNWYDQNISPLGKGYTMVALGLPHDQWKAANSSGWCMDNYLGPWELHLDAGRSQNSLIFGMPWMVHILEHEIRHALHYTELQITHSGKEDPTHIYLGDKHDLKGSLQSLDYEAINKYINGPPAQEPKPMNQAKVVKSKNSNTVYICYPIPDMDYLNKKANLEGFQVPAQIPNTDTL